MTNRLIIIKVEECEKCPFLEYNDTGSYWGFYSCEILQKTGKIHCGYSSDEIKENKDMLKDWFENQCTFKKEEQ